MGKRSCVAALAVALVLTGVAGPASADDGEVAPADLVEEILLDAADPVSTDGERLVAEVGDVTAVVPEELSDPLTVQAADGARVEVTLPQSESVTQAGAGEAAVTHELDDGSVLVPVVRSNGVLQVLSVLTDEAAPASFTYGVTVESGGSLALLPDGGVSVLSAEGDAAAIVAPPWAKDAEGRDIPTRFEIDGTRLTQVIDTQAAPDVVYPVVADPAVSVKLTKYTVVNVVKTSNWTNTSRQLGICKVQSGAGGGRCTISGTYSVDTSVTAGLGATKALVAANIGFSLSTSVSGTISWTSKPTSAGTTYKAWAVGTRATYRVQKWTGYKTLGMKTPNWKLESTSSTLTSFSPVRGFAVGT
ncbi:hypothetical protein [Streptomyces sp. AC495_CC817]|uniref:hypothetical protein n=1 Tax=Streptomyces sp. AC495_CC817 TaxID=2823900 RepID=UPI001C27C558|nr:hypothetical protein [Streptomyces sp. AC495_CC817]